MNCHLNPPIDCLAPSSFIVGIALPINDSYVYIDIPFYWIKFKKKCYDLGYSRIEVENAILAMCRHDN